jgi:protein-S-isoprenylcysteine O-methyltransferase Ste14
VVRFPPPVWALVYVLVGLAVSWLLGWPRMPGFPLTVPGIALTLLPWLLPIWAIVAFRREGTEINPTSPTNRALIVEGPYRYTRNPMYLGLVLVTLGIAVWVGTWPMFLVPVALFTTANWVHVPFEEAKMRRQFGATYDAYVGRVRRWV